MNHWAKISNNTGQTLELNMKAFFEAFEGNQIVRLEDEGVHEVVVECYPPQAEDRIRAYCQDQGVEYGRKEGLYVVITPVEA